MSYVFSRFELCVLQLKMYWISSTWIAPLLLLSYSRVVYTECENACYGHGYCTAYDMCICNRNWQANDCSERVCPFGLAFADTPKGDLDASGSIQGPDNLLVENSFVYPYGTTEMFPEMRDSDLTLLDDSAHYYMECSNAGVCDRTIGVCQCFDGFAGNACGRMSCPRGTGIDDKECSGHGVCRSIYQAAAADYNSVYRLWNKDTSRGCICDKGWYGGDCSMRKCKYGLDPMYLDDVSNIRYSKYFFAILTTSPHPDFTDGTPQKGPGYWSIRFHDINGQPWVSTPLPYGASCATIVEALESLPNSVIPMGGTYCQKSNILQRDPLNDGDGGFRDTFFSRYRAYFSGLRQETLQNKPAFWIDGFAFSYAQNLTTDRNLSGEVYRIQFLNNPGALNPPEIEINLGNGDRPSLYSDKGTLITKTWTDGQQGERIDHVGDHCFGVRVKIGIKANYHFLTFQGDEEKKILKKCLGESDFNSTNTPVSEPFDWDYGSAEYPHLVFLRRTVAEDTDGGFYAVLIYDTDTSVTGIDLTGTVASNSGGADGTFHILHPFLQTEGLYWPVYFELYTTKGVLHMVGNDSEASFDFASRQIFTTNVTHDVNGKSVTGDVSCEGSPLLPWIDCLDKEDRFFLLDPYHTQFNPPFLNLYTAKALYKAGTDYPNWLLYPNVSRFENRAVDTSYLHKNIIETDVATNWAQQAYGVANFRVYKFIPSENSTYEYVSECSNRGICNQFEGICECFHGYTGDGCTDQDALSI